jgi:hypothetical protein
VIRFRAGLLILGLGILANAARGQTLSPPYAEYRKKVDGMFTLRNDGEVPLATILELRSFALDSKGNISYTALDRRIHVQFGANSFVIPPHESHYVFYKATCEELPCWFAIINTLTHATPVKGGLRINIILPHFVYVSQRAKFKKGDVRIEALRGDRAGEYRLKFINLSHKLERVETVQAKGFASDKTYGGFPLFPEQTRWLVVEEGAPSRKAEFRIRFEGGLHLKVPPPEETEIPVPAS